MQLIKSEVEYKLALDKAKSLMDANEGTSEFDVLVELSYVIDLYEKKIGFELPLPNPIDAILAYLEMRGEKQAALGKFIGSRSTASQLIRKQRPLSLHHIRLINQNWGIPLEILVQEYEVFPQSNAQVA